jgi:hypothetical protein
VSATTSRHARAALLALLLCACGPGPFDFGPKLVPNAVSECNDGADNDADGVSDFPYDEGCESDEDPREELLARHRQCSDGIDNDGDGVIDFDGNHNGRRDSSDDPGCASASDDDEYNVYLPRCSNGLDDDDDALIDFPADKDCTGRNDDNEGAH